MTARSWLDGPSCTIGALRALAGLLVVAVAMAGCEAQSECKKPCERVAACKDSANRGKPILGDKAPPPDPQCLDKCRDHPEDFAACEGRSRTCEDLRNCRGAWRP
jgi:Cys-rich protein (TIGR04453 family)